MRVQGNRRVLGRCAKASLSRGGGQLLGLLHGSSPFKKCVRIARLVELEQATGRVTTVRPYRAGSVDQAESESLEHGLLLVDAAQLVRRIVDVEDHGALADAQHGAHFPGRLAIHRPAQHL